jgi:hypothetical protein
MHLPLRLASAPLHGQHRRTRPVEYFLLVEPRADGSVIGLYRDQPIADSVIDADGAHYVYAGIAPRLRSGVYDVEALKPGEWLVEPGLVYVATAGTTRKR